MLEILVIFWTLYSSWDSNLRKDDITGKLGKNKAHDKDAFVVI